MTDTAEYQHHRRRGPRYAPVIDRSVAGGVIKAAYNGRRPDFINIPSGRRHFQRGQIWRSADPRSRRATHRRWLQSDVADLLEDERSGLLVQRGDVNAIARGILRLHDDAPLSRRLTQAAQQIVNS